MKRLFIIALLLLATVVNAQIKVNGTVRDAETGDLLANATVQIEGTRKGVVCNSKGNFEFSNLSAGTITLRTSYTGYETSLKEINLQADQNLSIELYRKEIFTEQVVVTASRSAQMIGDVAGRVSLVSTRTIASTPKQTVDDLFKSTSGVYIDRGSGLYSTSATVNLRGITSNEQGRVLALVDGAPINKTDGGSVNWNRINPETIERIEIFKGPGSSIYGNNAMGGVINFISRKNTKTGYRAFGDFRYGSYNTTYEGAGVSGKISDINGLNFSISGFNRTGDGYNTYRDAYRDKYSVNAFLKELGLDAAAGYDVDGKTNIKFNYNYYDDKRGTGTTVKEENYIKQKTHFGSVVFSTELGDIKMNAGAFYQGENYLRTMEKYKTNSSGTLTSYDLIYVDADRIDFGANVNFTIPFKNNTVTAGAEFKRGIIDGADVYQTSTDKIANKGYMNFLSVFVQDNLTLTDNLSILAGLRIDHIKFTNGEFRLINPTSASSFMSAYDGLLAESNWTAVTPKISAQYKISENLNIYGAFSQGFRAATLDDLTRCGLIKLGFKNANPNLKPETIDNFEIGLNFDVDKTFFFMPSVYYMVGKDFMYYINTGQTINVSGKNRPVIIKDNITKIEFFGADIDLKYFMSSNFYAFANYTYTKSKIMSFTGNASLEGKHLTYTPDHLANFGITFMNPYVNATAALHYQGKQFINDDNSTVDNNGNSMIIDSGITVDLKFWKRIFNMFNAAVEVQNLFDVQTLTTYDRISLGRMITAGLTIEL